MKKISVFAISCLIGFSAFTQFTYKIKADSLLLTKDTCNAELIIENGTRNVKGFLYNTGNGRTVFTSGLVKLTDSTYLIGSDTLNMHGSSVTSNLQSVLNIGNSFTNSSLSAGISGTNSNNGDGINIINSYALGSGSAISVTNSGSGYALRVLHSGAGDAISINHSGSGRAIYISPTNVSGGTAIDIDYNNGSSFIPFRLRKDGVDRLDISKEGYFEMIEQSAPSSPATNYGRLYSKSDGKIYYKNSAGTEYDLTFSGAGGTVTSVATSSPLTGGIITGAGTIGINDAAADGTTKGAASFAGNDFNASSGNITIDYTNGQKASSSIPGFATSNQTTGTIGLTVDGQGATVSTGSKGFVTIPYNCIIANWYVSASSSGSIQFDIKRSGTSIVGSGNKPLLSSAQNGNAAASGWTSVSVSEGDVLEWVIDSATTITNATVVLKVYK